MKTLLTVLLCLSFQVAVAEEEKLKVDVHALDSDVDLSSIKNPAVKKHYGLPAAPAVAEEDKLPTPEERDKLLKAAGLESETAKWDDMDKDLLYRKARAFNLKELGQNYPKIKSDKLKKIRDIAQAQ